ncbi:MAG: DUF692 family protein [Myxococcales bacterium]|nr:DUF692 family protein [Myxococcales bacterium]
MSDFFRRVDRLPRLGIGVSTEYGARAAGGGLDPAELRRRHPAFGGFLEVGVEIAKGLDADARAWAAAGWPTTYHFLDLNLDEPEDFDAPWLDATRALLDVLKPAWICGDAGLWHVGPRERGHMLLLPPVLCAEAADAMAEGVARLRDATGLEVLPENPPGHVYVGDLHLLDFFARVAERADTGLLLDAAHLAIFQRVAGHDPLTAIDGFPCERVVEIHVAGASSFEVDGLAMIEDDHTTAVLPDTWAILEHVVPRAPNLKAVVFECERNAIEDCLPGFERIARTWSAGAR